MTMKSWRHHIIIIATVLITVLLLSGCSQTPGNTDDVYEYPIKPGHTSYYELLAACRIPEDILNNISTKGLVETVLNYPLWPDMTAYSNIQLGFNQTASRFNGLQELFKRQDGGVMLLAKYQSKDPAAFGDEWTDMQKAEYAISFLYIEVILAQEPVLKNLTSAQCRDLLEECFIKYQGKQQVTEYYGKYGLESTLRLMGCVLQQEGYASFMQKMPEVPYLQGFLDSGSFINDQIEKEILSQAEQYLAVK